MKITKTFPFDAAHQLVGHDGKCKNLHGHTYTLIVELEGSQVSLSNSPKLGFVADYTDVKDIVKRLVVDKMDHKFLAAGNEPAFLGKYYHSASGQTVPVLAQNEVCFIGVRTTAENLCGWVFDQLAEYLPMLSKVTMCETGSSSAELTRDEWQHLRGMKDKGVDIVGGQVLPK